jgi:hypothetical protein
MMNNLKGALKFMLSLGIMLCSIVLAISIFTHTTMLNQDFYLNSLEKSSYFTYLNQEIDDSFRNYSLITSIPEEVFSSSVSDDEIRNLTTDNINNTMAYMKNEKDYVDEKIEVGSLDSALKKYVSGISGEGSQLSTVTEEAAAIVNSHAVLFDVSAVMKYSQFQSLRHMLYTAYSKLYIIAAAFAVLIILLFILYRENSWLFKLWIGGALIAASLVILVPTLMGFIFNIPYRFAVENYYLKVALSSIALGYLKNLAISGTIMLAAGLGMLYKGADKSGA